MISFSEMTTPMALGTAYANPTGPPVRDAPLKMVPAQINPTTPMLLDISFKTAPTAASFSGLEWVRVLFIGSSAVDMLTIGGSECVQRVRVVGGGLVAKRTGDNIPCSTYIPHCRHYLNIEALTFNRDDSDASVVFDNRIKCNT